MDYPYQVEVNNLIDLPPIWVNLDALLLNSTQILESGNYKKISYSDVACHGHKNQTRCYCVTRGDTDPASICSDPKLSPYDLWSHIFEALS